LFRQVTLPASDVKRRENSGIGAWNDPVQRFRVESWGCPRAARRPRVPSVGHAVAWPWWRWFGPEWRVTVLNT